MEKLISSNELQLKNGKGNKSFWPEIITYCLFLFLFILVSIFHEPWFDEIQAWQIAKYTSLHDMLFSIPHYEGHPVLWFIILSIPAKLGLSVELGLKSVSILLSAIIAYLIIFKSPFPKTIRILLPFSYFIFFQYGIVTRPYLLLNLFFIIAAITFKKKDENPWLFVLSLFLLCLSTVYGMVIAAGIATAWLAEILFKDKKIIDKRILSLAVLLILAVLVLISILPANNSYIVNRSLSSFDYKKIAYTFFGILSDSFVTDCFSSFTNAIDWTKIWLAVVVSIIIYMVVFFSSSKEKLKYFAIPFLFFALFSGFVYLFPHHIGIGSSFLIFWFWICCNDEKSTYYFNIILKKIRKEDFKNKSLILSSVAIALISISVFWSLFAGTMDIVFPYNFGRETANFIKSNGLKDCTIFTPFIGTDEEDGLQYLNESTPGVCLKAYLNDDVIVNLDDGYNKGNYTSLIMLNEREREDMLSRIKARGLPDIIVTSDAVSVNLVYDNIVLDDYIPIYEIQSIRESIWKNKLLLKKDDNYSYLFLRKELLEKYNLKSCIE